MIFQFVLIFFYAAVFAFLVFKLSFFAIQGLKKAHLVGLWFFKVLGALLYVFIAKYVIEGGDIFNYYEDGLIVYDNLLAGDFLTYMQLTFGLNNVAISSNIAASVDAMGYWFDTSAYMMVRLNALFNLFTFGTGVYVNAIFFAFISFLAAICLAKVFQQMLNPGTKVLLVPFLMPSLWYWTAGMHKEGLSVFLAALLMFGLVQMHKSKYHYGISLVVIGFSLLFFTRFFIAALLLPPLLAYAISMRWSNLAPLAVNIAVFLFFGLVSYLIPKLLHTPNLVDAIIAKKALYEALSNANTAIDLGSYEQSYWGIIQSTPQALFNAIVRPHFLDVNSVYLGLASAESLLITILFVLSLFYVKNCSRNEKVILYLFISFSLSYLLLAGLIVPNLGAILRYRSVALFFLIPALFFILKKKDELDY